MTMGDFEWLSKIFSDTKHRAASLRQQSYLLLRDAKQARPMSSCGVCVYLWHSSILWKRINISSKIVHRRLATPFWFIAYQTSLQYSDRNPPSNAGVVCWNRDSEPISGSIACCRPNVVTGRTILLVLSLRLLNPHISLSFSNLSTA